MIRILTVPFLPSLGGFDPTPLETLQRQMEILEVTPSFFCQGGVPYWSMVLHCRPRPLPGDTPRDAMGGVVRDELRQRTDTRHSGNDLRSQLAELSETERALFQALRTWRATVADARGVPVFMILSNRQLVTIASLRPESLASLSSIPGIGVSRLKQHGKALLEIVAGFSDKASTSAELIKMEGGDV